MDKIVDPNDMIGAFLPLHIQTVLSGVSHCRIIQIKASTQPLIQENIFTTTPTSLLYGTLLLIFYSVLIYKGLTRNEALDYRGSNQISCVCQVAELYLNSASIYMFVLLSMYHRERMKSYFEKLNTINEKLLQYNNELVKNTVPKSVRCYFIRTSSLLFVLYGLTIYLAVEDWERRPTLILFMIYETTIIIQFATLLKVLQYQFENINKIFYKKYAAKKAMPKWLIEIKGIGINKLTLKSQTYLPNNADTLDCILNLHHKLCDLSKELNIMFGVQIVSVLTSSFISLLSQIYSLIVIQLSEWDDLLAAISSSATSLLKILTILEACTHLQSTSDFTRVILHRLRNFNEAVKEATEWYSLQFLHQRVKMSACGLFELNMTVLFSVVGAITTYLVILIQFNQSSDGNASNILHSGENSSDVSTEISSLFLQENINFTLEI